MNFFGFFSSWIGPVRYPDTNKKEQTKVVPCVVYCGEVTQKRQSPTLGWASQTSTIRSNFCVFSIINAISGFYVPLVFFVWETYFLQTNMFRLNVATNFRTEHRTPTEYCVACSAGESIFAELPRRLVQSTNTDINTNSIDLWLSESQIFTYLHSSL